MSVIDRALQGLQGGSAEPPTLSVPDALAAILVASVSVDGALSVDEAARTKGLLSTSRLFREVCGIANAGSVERAITLLNERGLATVLTACAKALPPDLHATVFAVAVDLVFSDGRVAARERAYIDSLQTALGVDDATALRIVEVLLIKNRA
jgi:hypothetical protein